MNIDDAPDTNGLREEDHPTPLAGTPAVAPLPGASPEGAPPRKRSMLLPAVLGVGGVMLLLFVILVAVGLALAGTSSSGSRRKLKEKLVEGTGDDKIVVIAINGVIMDAPVGGGLFGGGVSMVDKVVRELRAAADDEAVKAVILTVNSPGGTVTASDIIYHEVVLTKKAGKKIVVLMGDIAASGGYYISAPADSIIAHPTTVTGSIGVIMQGLNIGKLLEKIEIEPVVIKSAPMKDIGSSFREMTPEERKVLQDVIDAMYSRFVGIVAEGRGMTASEVRKVAQGQIYIAEKALELGLVDKTGYWAAAVEEAKSLAGLTEAKVVEYSSPPSLAQLFGATSSAASPLPHRARELADILANPVPMYLWQPGL